MYIMVNVQWLQCISSCDSSQLTVWLCPPAWPNLLSLIVLTLDFQSDQFAFSNSSIWLIGFSIFLNCRLLITQGHLCFTNKRVCFAFVWKLVRLSSFQAYWEGTVVLLISSQTGWLMNAATQIHSNICARTQRNKPLVHMVLSPYVLRAIVSVFLFFLIKQSCTMYN